MQAEKEGPKKPGKSELEMFMGSGDNTHNPFTSVTVLSALRLLVSRYEARPDAHGKITSELIINGIIPNDQEKAREFKLKLDEIARRNQDQWDYVTYYNHESGSEEKIVIRMKEVLQYLIAALSDQGKFRRTTYVERLEKFYEIIRWFQVAECNTGRRHDLMIEMLHDDYEGVFIITEVSTSIETIRARFYEDKFEELQKTNPEEAFVLMCEWMECTVINLISEKTLAKFDAHDAFFHDGEALKSHLVDYFERSGFKVDFEGLEKENECEKNSKASDEKSDLEKSAIQLAKYIQVSVDTRSDIPFVSPTPYQREIGYLEEIWKRSKKNRFVKERLAKCRRLSDLELLGLDVLLLCERLRDKSQRHQTLLPLGKEEGELRDLARKVYTLSTQYLAENPEWTELRVILSQWDNDLSKAIHAATKQPHSELIRDSFAMLCGEEDPFQFNALHTKITDCFVANNLALKNDEIEEWIGQYVEVEAGQTVVTLTPYAMSRVCWHALMTSPKDWSESFIRLFENVVIPLISLALEDEDKTIDESNKKFIKDSFKELLTEFVWLLSLAKKPGQNLTWPWHLVFPANLSGMNTGRFRYFEDFVTATFYDPLVNAYPGRFREWIGELTIDDMIFKRSYDRDALYYDYYDMLLLCPLNDRFNLLMKFKEHFSGLSNTESLEAIIITFRVFALTDQCVDGRSDVLSVFEFFEELMAVDLFLPEILHYIPEDKRAEIIIRFKDWINIEYILFYLESTPPKDRPRLMAEFHHRFEGLPDFFVKALELLPALETPSHLWLYRYPTTQKFFGLARINRVSALLPEVHRFGYILREFIERKKRSYGVIPKEEVLWLQYIESFSDDECDEFLRVYDELVLKHYDDILYELFKFIDNKVVKYRIYLRYKQQLCISMSMPELARHVPEDKRPEVIDSYNQFKDSDEPLSRETTLASYPLLGRDSPLLTRRSTLPDKESEPYKQGDYEQLSKIYRSD